MKNQQRIARLAEVLTEHSLHLKEGDFVDVMLL